MLSVHILISSAQNYSTVRDKFVVFVLESDFFLNSTSGINTISHTYIARRKTVVKPQMFCTVETA